MDQQRWHQVQELYYSALPLSDEDRQQFLATTCASDTVLRHELNSLFEADETSGEFLNTPIVEVGLSVLAASSTGSQRSDYSGNPGPGKDWLIDQTLEGRYEIVEHLGSGGVGDVYRAHDTKILYRTVVIKVLKDSSVMRPWIVAKFQQEIEALTKISDPGVVGIIDTGKLSDGRPFLVMEFVEGSNLRDFIRGEESHSGRLKLEQVSEIIRQAGRSVTSAHEAGVVHRDLKPANIMVRRNASGDLQVKIIDFGVAKIANSLSMESTSTGLIAGTVAYMAPEQLEGRKVQPVSDIYALGVIAYEMITGNRPFNPESQAALQSLQREGVKVAPRDLRPALPLAAQNVILKALAYQPADRYQRAREFGDALADALLIEGPLGSSEDQSSIPATPERFSQTPPAEIVLPKRDMRMMRIAGLLIVGMLLVTGTLYAVKYVRWKGNERQLSYSLTVQRNRDGLPYKDQFSSWGGHIFDTGDQFKLNISSSQSGYLYVFNEGSEDDGSKTLTIIYPTTSQNKEAAKLNVPAIETGWNNFEGRPGTEEFWIIWSAAEVPTLEKAREDAFKHNGAVSNPALITVVRDFLRNSSMVTSEAVRDPVKPQLNIRADGDLLVKLVEIAHQ